MFGQIVVVHDYDLSSPSCSVENSEYLSDLLKEQNIPHNVLNARPKVINAQELSFDYRVDFCAKFTLDSYFCFCLHWYF